MQTLPNSEPTAALPTDISRQVFASLCTLQPPSASDTAEARADRDAAAMASVVALHPADAFQADLAAQIVGAAAHVRDCLRLAAQAGVEASEAHRHRAQAIAMMRQMLSLLRALQRLQGVRPAPEARTPVSRAASPPPPSLDLGKLTEVEKYAVTHPDRAARIRAAGGLPKPLDFPPPRHSLVRAIVASTSPLLQALDQPAVA